MREDEATAGASDEREVEELDMELVVNHERIAWIRYAQVCNVLGQAHARSSKRYKGREPL